MNNGQVYFVKALKRATIAYMQAVSKSALKKQLRKTIEIAQNTATRGIVNGIRISGAFSANYTTGNIFLDTKRFSKRLIEAINKQNDKFMEEIFLLSQEYVPIDKRYAQATKVAYLNTGRKSINSIIRTTEGSGYTAARYLKDTEYWARTDSEQSLNYDVVNFKRKSGWYKAEHVSYIKDMFRGGNRYTRYARYIYDSFTKTVKTKSQYQRNAIDTGMGLEDKAFDLPANLKQYRRRSSGTSGGNKKKNKYSGSDYTTIQPSGGYQELKKSGKLTKINRFAYQITYSAYDKTRPNSTFNYAALQHDNMKFKHEYGKSLFLYRAFTKVRRQWYDNIQKAVQKEIDNASK